MSSGEKAFIAMYILIACSFGGGIALGWSRDHDAWNVIGTSIVGGMLWPFVGAMALAAELTDRRVKTDD